MKDFAGDEFFRNNKYTPPRSLTLDTKYEGAVTVCPHTGYAINIVDHSGNRRVVLGPSTVMLEYDEMLELAALSKGVPKDKNNKKETVYLKVLDNRLTDKASVQTKDLVDIDIYLAYRVSFEGDQDKWFNVNDYVALLTDHMRSVLRNEIQKYGIEEFWNNKIDIIRDSELGEKPDDDSRPGRLFSQNGMRIYDVDVKETIINDKSISELLVDAKHETIRQKLNLEQGRRELETFVEGQDLSRVRQAAEEVTSKEESVLLEARIKREESIKLLEAGASNTVKEFELSSEENQQEVLDNILNGELSRRKLSEGLNTYVAEQNLHLRVRELNAHAKAEIDRINAITPDLIAAMQALGNTELVGKISENFSLMSILGGTSLAEVAQRVLQGTSLEDTIKDLPRVLGKSVTTQKGNGIA